MSRHATPAELVALMETAAKRLTGRSVTARLRRPNTAGQANGAAYKDTSGQPVIDIDPLWLGWDEELFRIFTHECAHIKLHFPIMRAVEIDAAIPLVSKSKHEDAATAKREREAEALASLWRAKVDNYYYGLTDKLRRLAQ